jgi:hypothetical protein
MIQPCNARYSTHGFAVSRPNISLSGHQNWRINVYQLERIGSIMAEPARWSLKVSRETDIALRTLLATRGGRKGDLSRFVEEAVNREVLRETVRDIQARNVDASTEELERLVDDELGAARASFWSTPRR